MAEAKRYICSDCDKSILAWDDGNPYYIDAKGKKKYAHHPDPMRDKCTGNDSDVICLGCGEIFILDDRASAKACPKCKSADIAELFELEGRQCPYCKKGKFAVVPGECCIS